MFDKIILGIPGFPFISDEFQLPTGFGLPSSFENSGTPLKIKERA
jgi:hypothetical protein